MSESTKRNRLLEFGWLIKGVGCAICTASYWFYFNTKANSWSILALFATTAVMAGVSAFYFIAREFSPSWKTKAVQSFFSPYIIGATIWISVIGILYLVRRFFG